MLDPGPAWRLPPNAPVAVLGAGLMGHAIAAIFLAHGYNVTCCDPSESARESLPERVDAVLDILGRRDGKLGLLTSVADSSQLDPGTLFVVEAAPELLPLKQQLLVDVAMALPHAVIATNSSVFCVKDVTALMSDRDRVVGTHWWNPPHLIPLVEVVQSVDSDPAVVRGVFDLLVSLGKSPVHVKLDTPGFIGNRLQHALWREAMALIQEGVCDAAAVDHVIRNSMGLRLSEVGPIENADYVGLDLTLAIHSYIFPSLSTARAPLKILQDAVAAGDLGAKTGRGFLEWPEGKKEETARRLSERVQLLTALASGPNS